MGQDGHDDHGAIDGFVAGLSDAELVNRLREEVPPGLWWALTERLVAGYAIRTLHAAVLRGTVNRKLAALNRPIHLTDAELDRLRDRAEERGDLINESVTRGLRRFRDHGVRAGAWRPGGASVRTYATNACFLELPNMVRGWRAHHRHENHRPHHDLEEFETMGLLERLHPQDDLGYIHERRAELDQVIIALDGELAKAALLRWHHDLTWAECAQHLGISPRVLEGRLRRFRQSYSRDEETPP
jgi:DNA-directed RNA polymerase specialized sigma24 family protein